MKQKLTPSLKNFLEENKYFELCEIGDNVVGLHKYFTTLGLVVGLTLISYERRYCYQDPAEAYLALEHYKKNPKLVHPSGNWIKVKGRMNGKILDDMNPNWKE